MCRCQKQRGQRVESRRHCPGREKRPANRCCHCLRPWSGLHRLAGFGFACSRRSELLRRRPRLRGPAVRWFRRRPIRPEAGRAAGCHKSPHRQWNNRRRHRRCLVRDFHSFRNLRTQQYRDIRCRLPCRRLGHDHFLAPRQGFRAFRRQIRPARPIRLPEDSIFPTPLIRQWFRQPGRRPSPADARGC